MVKNSKAASSNSYFYDFLISLGNFLQDIVLLLFRLYWGYGFLTAGWSKIMSHSDSVSFFNSLNIPYPEFFVFLVAGIEFLGGLCLILGLASRLVAIPLIITMVVALMTAHNMSWGDLINQDKLLIQAPITFLIVSIIIFTFGPGRVSLDYLFEKLYFRRGK